MALILLAFLLVVTLSQVYQSNGKSFLFLFDQINFYDSIDFLFFYNFN